jgi:hypothetical protein
MRTLAARKGKGFVTSEVLPVFVRASSPSRRHRVRLRCSEANGREKATGAKQERRRGRGKGETKKMNDHTLARWSTPLKSLCRAHPAVLARDLTLKRWKEARVAIKLMRGRGSE